MLRIMREVTFGVDFRKAEKEGDESASMLFEREALRGYHRRSSACKSTTNDGDRQRSRPTGVKQDGKADPDPPHTRHGVCHPLNPLLTLLLIVYRRMI